ncbi:MAG: septum formation initiator family protein [Candidatus Portnoybacteria bacterium]|nr:septum formation initiator family protein [Candidatus Portnoybacteria bacterium]
MKKIFSSRWLMYLLLLVAIWLLISLARTFYKKNQLDNEISALKNEIGKLEKSDQELGQLIELFNDQDYLEQEAKAKLNFKKEGESVVIVPSISEDIPLAAALPSPAATSPQMGNLLKWWQYFFGR